MVFERLVTAAISVFFVLSLHASFLETVFTQLYDRNAFVYEAETVSGAGASMAHTETIRQELPALLKKYNITSILDVGCGDFNWMQHVITDDITYIGMDVVKQLIDENNEKYGADNISFVHGDGSSDDLPKVDLIICRDVLAHFPYRYALKMIENFIKSGSTYVFFTTYSGGERENKDLPEDETGGNYCINMQKEPFSLVKPICLINEKCPSPYHLITPDKSLALWRVETLQHSSSAVTYLDNSEWGGRLGDKLLMYIKARWIAYKYDLFFFYKSFKYSDQLKMYEMDTVWDDEYLQNYNNIQDPYQGIKDPKNRSIELDEFINADSKLHIINYYFQPKLWGNCQALYDSQDVGEWTELYEDEGFRDLLRERIKPSFSINKISLPKDRITVALHVRKGGGFDGDLLSLQLYGDGKPEGQRRCFCASPASDYTDVGYLLKLPPDQFYVDQIRYLSQKYNDAPMYVHLFTDDSDPQNLIDRYARAVDKSNISYGCRDQGNRHDEYVLDDLFNMIRFDCLIRSGSNFPQVAQLIGNYKVVLYPKHAEWRSILNIHEVGVKTDSSNQESRSA